MTGQRAIELVASLTGIPLVTLSVIVRVLRKNGLWPQSKQGGGRAAVHVEAIHLAALWLAIGQDAITDAAEAASLLGSLRNVRHEKQDFSFLDPVFQDGAGELVRTVESSDLVSVLSFIIDWYSRDPVYEYLSVNRRVHLEVKVNKRRDIGAFVSIHLNDTLNMPASYESWHIGVFQDMSFPPSVQERMAQWPAAVAESRSFMNTFVQVLATCWRDTKAHHNKSSSGPSALGGAEGPETEVTALGGAVTSSQSEHFRSDNHPQTHPNAFSKTRMDGRSAGGRKARPEGESFRLSPLPKDHLSHVAESREHARA